ncbi:MAG: 1,4-dihydroxy-2-naphthoate polyprenyltransferase [Ignavibacteriales bacterium]|nr:MAG: 1,4-dihydroxy-2-naphthoate polyprenyltransferase [Ignavibacteriales bacterium]
MKTNKFNSWLLASRPKTLLAAFVPVMVGTALAVNTGKFNFIISLIALICSLLIQVGTNFTNDLYDYLNGADTQQRKGPVRVLSSGLISTNEMKAGIFITFIAAFLLGLYLVYIGGVIILIIGIISISAGLAYTAGPYPLAYKGLGDIFVFMFFGLIGTMGTYYLHTNEISLPSFFSAIPVGALITNILVVNNYRDIEEDRQAGKNTLAVKLGRTFTKYQFIFLIIVSFLTPLVLFLSFDFNAWIFLPYLTLPVAFNITKMLLTHEGQQLNKTLELTAKLSALYGILFSTGLVL